LHNFIWNNKNDLVNRNTLILPYEKGGLGIFNLEAKIKTILFQQFLYICHNYKRTYYQFSVYWLKFIMRTVNVFDLNSINFNLIPSSKKDDNIFYCKMSESVKEIKKYVKEFTHNLSKYNSKNSYIEFRKEYDVIPRSINLFGENLEWEKIFKNRNRKKLDSDLRSFDYRVLVDGLCLSTKVKGKLSNKCFLCDKGDDLNM
jgi:hypothetical protein